MKTTFQELLEDDVFERGGHIWVRANIPGMPQNATCITSYVKFSTHMDPTTPVTLMYRKTKPPPSKLTTEKLLWNHRCIYCHLRWSHETKMRQCPKCKTYHVIFGPAWPRYGYTPDVLPHISTIKEYVTKFGRIDEDTQFTSSGYVFTKVTQKDSMATCIHCNQPTTNATSSDGSRAHFCNDETIRIKATYPEG